MRTSVLAGILVAAIAAGGTVAVPAPTLAAETVGRISAQDRQLLTRLSPDTREKVMSRMSRGQTVEGIVETMALNRLWSQGARDVQVDTRQGHATVVDANGKRQTISLEEVMAGSAGSAGSMHGGGTTQRGASGQQQWGTQPQSRETQPRTPYPSGLGKGDQGVGRTSEGNMGPRERGLGEKPAP